MFLRSPGSQKRIGETQGKVEMPKTRMAYSDLWTNNVRCKLTEKLAAGKLMRILPPPRTTNYRGDSVWPKTRSFPPIPKDVTRLEVRSHDFPGSVGFHEGIRWLDISDSVCEGEFHFPKSLEVLIWRNSNCPWYEGRFQHLPNLKQLDWSGRPITHLGPGLPKSLEILQLKGCYELVALPPLPEGLRVLDIRGCEKLKTLPEIPDSVEEIWYEGCTGLQPRELWSGPENYWSMPKWLREDQEEETKVRIQKRTRALRQEIVAAAYHPRRVERWLEECGWDFLDVMLG